MYRRLTAAGLAGALALAACGDDDNEVEAGNVSNEEAGTTTTEAAPAEATGLTGELTYRIAQGEPPLEMELVIQPEGDAVLTIEDEDYVYDYYDPDVEAEPQVEEITLTDDDLAAVAEALDEVGWGQLPDRLPAEEEVLDTRAHIVAYDGDEVWTEAPARPNELEPLLVELDRIIEPHR